ncbi:MAG: 6,7-dimethyl-8-ribityllumazine synthase [Candidatus Limnocylindria bacterium]
MAGKRPAARTASAPGARTAVVVAGWNSEVTARLADGALAVAEAAGASADRFDVAGSFELPAAAAILAATGRYDAVVPIGCLVRGETPHFDVLARAVADGLMRLSLEYPVAIPFGVLTCDTIAQARARAGGRAGNKGREAMEAALAMVALRQATAPTRRRIARRAASASARSTSTKLTRSPGTS